MCEPRIVYDKDGGSFMVGDAGDVWFPPFHLANSYTQQLDILRNLNIRDDDVIMTGYGKCGSHWHFEILSMLQRGVAEYLPESKAQLMIDRLSANEVDALPSPRVLNTHVPLRYFPRQAIEKKTKIILLVRNPKDVCVSMYNHMRDWTKGGYSGTWDNFVQLFLHTGVWYGKWTDIMVDWEKEMNTHPELPIFVSSYEDMQKDPVGQIERLSHFLGLPRPRALCEQIAARCSFSQLRTASESKKSAFPPDIWAPGSPGFFRKGQVGDWKNWLTADQNREFDQVYEAAMKDSKLNIVFEL